MVALAWSDGLQLVGAESAFITCHDDSTINMDRVIIVITNENSSAYITRLWIRCNTNAQCIVLSR